MSGALWTSAQMHRIDIQQCRWHYYLFDFCYFVNCLLLVRLWLLPQSAFLHKVGHPPARLGIYQTGGDDLQGLSQQAELYVP